MLITRTPFRISFLGGGSDYPTWYNSHMGMVLGATINKFCYITYQPNQEKFRILYSQLEECQDVTSIQHPAIKACLEYLDCKGPASISHASDLPSRSGIGSSSAFVVGLLKALIPSDKDIANIATLIEQDILKEPVGSQDQILCHEGGINQIVWHPTGAVESRCISSDDLTRDRLDELQHHLMLVYVGPRSISPPTPLTFDIDTTRRLATMAKEGTDILTSGADILDFGLLLDEAWRLKKQMSPSISTHDIDTAYQRATFNGAIGGKILGSGGGGFMLIFAKPEYHGKITTALGLEKIPFEFEHEGSKVIYDSRYPNPDIAEVVEVEVERIVEVPLSVEDSTPTRAENTLVDRYVRNRRR